MSKFMNKSILTPGYEREQTVQTSGVWSVSALFAQASLYQYLEKENETCSEK